MSERFSWTEPQLCHYDFNLKKNWFIYFDYKDNQTGEVIRKQFRYGINKHKTKKERLLLGNALTSFWKLKLNNGWNPFPEEQKIIIRPTVCDAMDLILKIKKTNIGVRAYQTYSHIIRTFKEWLVTNNFDTRLILNFDSSYAQAYMDHLILKKNYSGRTYNDHLNILCTFFNCCTDRDWLLKNPFSKISKLPVEIGRNIAFKEKEKELLKNHLYNNDRNLYYFTQFIYYCFIRRSELTRLKIENIDFDNWTIVIPSGASKNKRQESVVIPRDFVSELKQMNLQQLPNHWFIFGRYLKPGPEPYINYNHISSRHNKISNELGIGKEKGLYSWKHTGVCDVYPLLKGDIYALMRQLRHTDLTTTQIYLKSLGLVDNLAIRNANWGTSRTTLLAV